MGKKNPFVTVQQIKNTLKDVDVDVSKKNIKRLRQQNGSPCKFTKKTKRYLDEEADPMFVAKAGKFISQPAVETTA